MAELTISTAGLNDDGFEEDQRPDRSADETLVIDIDGFEGPLDLLLNMARDQKVDLTRISILALAEQYLQFIDGARQMRLEIAADYLVMAAWLAYLKSRLLLPDTEESDEPSGDALAAALAFRLRRLEAMRDAAAKLMNRDRLGRNRFARGMPEPVIVLTSKAWEAGLYDLLEAYGSMRQRQLVTHMHIARRSVMTLKQARDRLIELIGTAVEWTPIDSFLTEYLVSPELRASARASSLSASLELVKEGAVELRQSEPFSALYLRRKSEPAKTLQPHIETGT
jgi:segregation and condensation protein A